MSESYHIAARRGFITAGGTRLSYLDWGGAGSPALLLHGITSDATTLWRVAPALGEAGYRPIALDMPGHGESDVSPAHDIGAIAALAGECVLALGLREVLLIGHSWGGATALALAGGEHPAREALARVVLVDPALGIEPQWGAEKLPGYLEGIGEPASKGVAAIRAKNPAWLDEDVYWKAHAMERCRREQVVAFFVPPAAWSLGDRLGRVSVPMLLLAADPAYSVIPAHRHADVRAAMDPGLGRLVVVPGTNHNMFRGPGYTPSMAALQAWLAA